MIETDAPYLLPRDIKPAPKTRRNEPHYLPYVVRAIAAARGESVEAVRGHASTATARQFFGLPSRYASDARGGIARRRGIFGHGARASRRYLAGGSREPALERAVERGFGVVARRRAPRVCTLRLVVRSASAPSSSRQSVR